MRLILSVFCLLFGLFTFAQSPVANFSASPLQVCLGASINFTNLSAAGSSPIASWDWDFGDGSSSTSVNPSHTYTSAGTYTVTLVVTDQNNNADAEVKPVYITVNPLPNAGFTTTGNGCTVPFDVTFTNTSAAGPNITYAWNFGNSQNSTATNPPPVTYSAAGNYSVSLTVTNTTTGCVNTYSESISVSNFSAGMILPADACVGEPILVLDASTVGANQWNWNFGNGQTSTQQNPPAIYTSPGTFTVSMLAQNTASGCQDVVTQTIVINPLPTPSFSANQVIGCAPLTVTFANMSPGGSSYLWNFGNGLTSTSFNPTTTYNNNGSYSVTLTMIDGNGCPGIFTATDLINVSGPVVDFTMDNINGCAPVTVQFTDLSVAADPVGDPLVTWQWNFGDGSPIFTGQVPPPHTYPVGVFSPTLTVFSQSGCQGQITFTDTIQVGSLVNVNFTVNPTSDCAKSPFTFTNLTTFNGTPGPGEVSYFWEFGDSGISFQENPTYYYPLDTGYFDVQLIVNWRGCEDTFTMVNAVYIKAPISIFTPDQYLVCNPGSFPVTINFNDMAVIGETSDDVEMNWEWGDGTFTYFDDADVDDANQGSTSHNYSTYGSYIVEQVIYNHTTGCEDSTNQTIHISQTIANFNLSTDSICAGLPVIMTSTSTSTHPFGTFSYNMGNGNTVNGIPASYTYSAWGTYNITLTATNFVGCSDTHIFSGMEALANPLAQISPSDVAGCAPITVTYTNTSTPLGNGAPLALHVWTFPDLSVQALTSQSSTNYTYTTEGTFTTNLIVTDAFGCVSPLTSVNMTITKPTADFTLDSVVCDEEVFLAQNTSQDATNYQWFVDGNSASFNSNFTSSFNESSDPLVNSTSHTVEMIATDQNGCMDTMTQVVVVSTPTAMVDYTVTGANVNGAGEFTCPPVFADFTDESNSYGNISNYNWNLGNGNSSTLQDPSNTYVFAGTYTASLAITDEFGCTSDTALIDFLTIFGPSGNPNWTSVGDICGQSFIFAADNLNSVDNIIWDMGDGTVNEGLTPFNYTYQSFQTYNPIATLVDEFGCEVPMNLPPIYVINNGLDAYFEATPTEGPMGTDFVFDESSTSTTAPIAFWNWDLGGTLQTETSGTNVVHDFGVPGTYTVTLVVADTNGCFDTYALNVVVTNTYITPNVFTPDGDGINDFFELAVDIFASFDVVIVNRWGNVVHQRTNATGTYLWDGLTQAGLPANDGVYFYRLMGTLVDGTPSEKHGNVSLFGNP